MFGHETVSMRPYKGLGTRSSSTYCHMEQFPDGPVVSRATVGQCHREYATAPQEGVLRWGGKEQYISHSNLSAYSVRGDYIPLPMHFNIEQTKSETTCSHVIVELTLSLHRSSISVSASVIWPYMS